MTMTQTQKMRIMRRAREYEKELGWTKSKAMKESWKLERENKGDFKKFDERMAKKSGLWKKRVPLNMAQKFFIHQEKTGRR